MQQFGSPSRRQTWLQRSTALLTVLVFSVVGVRYYGVSSAATASYNHNPTAFADYCTLEGNSTVLYGWAHDPDATPAGSNPNVNIKVGGSTVTVASSIGGYRDAEINTYLKGTFPGEPTSSIYGWRLVVGTVYKGTVSVVSGTVKNVGTGVDMALAVNTTHSVDGHIYFNSNGSIPDACLASKPVAAPAPTPAPAPPAPTGGGVAKPKPVTPSAPTPASPSASSASDATVTTGTTTASLSIPTGNATSIYIKYGTDASNLSVTSDTYPVGSDQSVTVLLKNLGGKTAYSFQIVRVLGTQNSASATANFTTKGFSISLNFTDSKGKPVKGIVTELNSKKQTSDEKGIVTFNDLPEGSYSATFVYNGQTYSQDFSTSSADTESGTDGIVLDHAINVSKLSASQRIDTSVKKKSSSSAAGIVISIVLVLLFGFGIWWWLRRRRSNDVHVVLPPPPASTVPQPIVSADLSQDIAQQQRTAASSQPPQNTLHHANGVTTPLPAQVPAVAPTHIGESLRDMVLQSMAEEAAKHPENKPKPPIVPGGR